MRAPFVGIGITTYRDISSPDYGEAIFDAYQRFAPSLTPDTVRIQTASERFPVSDARDFGQHWRTEASFALHEDRGSGRVIDKGAFIIGAQWQKAGRGGGEVMLRPETFRDKPDGLLLRHPYQARIDWWGIFRRLIDICTPAYAMLHVFTDEDVTDPATDRFARFDGPFAGEEHFTSWLSDLGEWRKPDRWQHEERRRYRYLPELSWANFLGEEFAGQFDVASLRQHASQVLPAETGVLFTVTPELSDVVKTFPQFKARRRTIKTVFREGLFRRVDGLDG